MQVVDAGPGSVRLILTRERDLLRPTGTLGSTNLGELSPLNLATYAWRTAAFRVHAGGGPIRPYRVTVRVLSPLSVPAGNLAPRDVGFGVTDIRSCSEVVNPIFAGDPRTAPKNGDGIPLFAGDLGDCTGGAQELFRTGCSSGRRTHFFTLVWAVGPQFFTPQSPIAVEVLLTLEVL